MRRLPPTLAEENYMYTHTHTHTHTHRILEQKGPSQLTQLRICVAGRGASTVGVPGRNGHIVGVTALYRDCLA